MAVAEGISGVDITVHQSDFPSDLKTKKLNKVAVIPALILLVQTQTKLKLNSLRILVQLYLKSWTYFINSTL
ncbi:hypothetical protein TSUD_11740 [Trifolium subterraneum]|uniref:Uncharacterized protein n=1 Tax=Trifolium subterraneum TaxID=3900 RepID=A0A2Z6PVK3_TRISU|nr:hypothetical protein TSUD_11740 [Trifolium subterraneum]